MAKRLLKNIRPYVDLYINDNTGIAWVENGSTGNGHSAHPNIDASGSVRGMKSRGYWDKSDKTVRCNGFIYNISRVTVTDDLDKIAEENCRCEECTRRRREV